MADKIHRIKIEQDWSSDWASKDATIERRYMTIKLIEKQSRQSTASGLWKPTSQSYNGEKIEICAHSNDGNDMRWLGRGGAWGGTLWIGTQSTSASSQRDEDNYQLFETLVLLNVGRDAMRRFHVRSILEQGGGYFVYPAAPHFTRGPVLWSPYDYSYSYTDE